MTFLEVLHSHSGNCPSKVLRAFVAEIKKETVENIMFHADSVELLAEEIEQLEQMIARYQRHEPISKIINRKAFWNDEFFVTADVLDPRPETELIIEQALKLFDNQTAFRFLDIGTGSGCILLSLAKEFPNAYGIGIDLSPKAVEVAKINQSRLNVKNAEIFCCGWNDFQPKDQFVLIVSNPPYIKSEDIENLEDAVKNYDPLLALDGGDSGIEAYKQLSLLVANWLAPNGILLLEVGINQAQPVQQIFERNGFSLRAAHPDLQQIPRVMEFLYSEDRK